MTRSRITSIEVHATEAAHADGLKGQLFDQSFTGVDLLVGPNGYGKTTHGPLVILAALQGLASVPTDPMRPYVDALEGQSTLPSGTSVTLTVRSGSHSYDSDDISRYTNASFTRDISVNRGKSDAEATKMAGELVGVPMVSADLSSFANGTDGQRKATLDKIARAGGKIKEWSVYDAKIATAEALGHDPDNGAPDWVLSSEICQALLGGDSAATWLISAQTWATAKQTETNSEQKDAHAHATELGASLGPEPAWTDDDQKQHADLTKRIALAAHADAGRIAAASAVTRWEKAGTRLQLQLDTAAQNGKRLATEEAKPVDSSLGPIRDRIAVAEGEIGTAIPGYEGQDLDGLRGKVLDAEHDLNRARETETSDKAKGKDAESLWAKAIDAKTKADHELEVANNAIMVANTKLETLGNPAESRCVHCGESDPLGQIAAIAQLNDLINDPLTNACEEANQQSAHIDSDHEKAKQHRERAQRSANDSNLARGTAEDNLIRCQANLKVAEAAPSAHAAQVTKSRQSELDGAKAELQRAVNTHIDSMRLWRHREEQREQSLTNAREHWSTIKTELDQWKTRKPEEPVEVSDEDTRIAKRKLQIMQDKKMTHLVWHSGIDKAREAAATADRATADWESVKALLAAIKATRDEMAATAYKPIQDAARALQATAKGLPEPYFDGPDSFGALNRHGVRVPFAGLSQSEQMITGALLVYALAVVADQPCRMVLLDGLEVVEESMRDPLIKALVAAQQRGDVDNVVMTMSADEGDNCMRHEWKGMKVHVMAKPVARNRPEPVVVNRNDAARVSLEQEAGRVVRKPPTQVPPAPDLDDCPF